MKKFPNKAKLITDGGFYKIIPIDRQDMKITIPTMRKIKINTPDIDFTDTFNFVLKFAFRRVYKGYAEYVQYDLIKIS
jgi:hypothetical protein